MRLTATRKFSAQINGNALAFEKGETVNGLDARTAEHLIALGLLAPARRTRKTKEGNENER